jgi:regulator of cell morphogenesis and NO signaling
MTKLDYSGGGIHLSREMKIFELIDAYPVLLSVFSRLGITLPFGDISVAEMCQRDNHSPELFLILCRMHIDASYRPRPSELRDDMLLSVVGYLRATHRYYTDYMLPHAGEHLDEILGYCDELSRSMLTKFYNDYVRYIEQHLDEEEQTIFTLVESAAAGSRPNIASLEVPHSDIDDRTNDIASLIIKCLPEAAPTQLRCAMLSHIYALRDDLRRHYKVEVALLRPLIVQNLNPAKQ